MSNRASQKAALRQERLAAEAGALRAAGRRRRVWQLGALVALAVAVVAVALATSSTHTTNSAPSDGALSQTAEVGSLLRGIPQSGQTLGRAGAPVTLTEFADLKCPICRQFSAQALPDLVQRYVRTGKLRIVFEPQTFVGSPAGDSERAARAALAAGAQGRMWQFSELWYANQQDENTAYATDAFIRRLADSVAGLDVNQMLSARATPAVDTALARASSRFRQAGFQGTPSFLLGRTGQQARALKVTSFDPSQFTTAIDALLA